MRQKLNFLAAVLVLGVAQGAAAGGTLGTEELDPLLAQKPVLRAALLGAFNLSESAFGAVRLGHHFPNLSGRRLGPYFILATAKQSHEPVQIVLCTSYAFIGNQGQVLSEAEQESASAVSETLVSVMLVEPEAGAVNPCK